MVKLLRTDTTLDLSQKARVVRIQNGQGLVYIVAIGADAQTLRCVSRRWRTAGKGRHPVSSTYLQLYRQLEVAQPSEQKE